MRIRNTNRFETNVQHECQVKDGLFTRVGETYVVDALTLSEAEDVITKEMTSYSSGEFVTKNVTPVVYSEIFFSGRETDDKWHRVKLMLTTTSEEKGKEKCMAVSYLVQAKNIEGVLQNVDGVFSSGVFDHVMANVSETKIMDVFEHDLKKEPGDQPEV